MKALLKKHIINVLGKRLDRKFVIFESDDWGSIRIEGKNTQEQLLRQGLISANDPFSMLDCLETSVDYQRLFEVLSSYKDSKGKRPVFTANFIMGNPDFSAIASSGFKEFHHEKFFETYQKVSEDPSAWETLEKGMERHLILPQFHGREHLNVVRWLNKLRSNDSRFLEAFNLKCFAISSTDNNRRGNLMASYDYVQVDELTEIQTSIAEGLQLFEKIFGFKSETTIAPCYVWDREVEKVFHHYGVRLFQGSRYQLVPAKNDKRFTNKYHYNGQANSNGQFYTVRNSLFEPALNSSINWIEKCIESISIAFKWGKPAVIGTHRINYVGGLDEGNRELNLEQLDALLQQIVTRWPEVEFISSADLLKHYSNG